MPNAGKHRKKKLYQYTIYLAISLVVLVLFWVMNTLDSTPFRLFFGDTNPLVLATFYVVLGLLLFWIHLSKNWLRVYRKENTEGLILAAALALVFGVITIMIDLISPFPEGINLPFPLSLLFYPAIGFVVEILFHLLPLTLLLWLTTKTVKRWSLKDVIWPVIILVAFLEPQYQVLSGFGTQDLMWTDIYVGVYIFLINLTQLWLFKRYDFVSMYLFRLVY
ncbi:hypothetical protein G3570_00235 [Balneolaceae bacterium YR4-1]|uniref:CPBP family intramembrane metalloprotease n=1 Tax=Halalkalibaculum roseum TaxID=2709311 RepID=A0A6M1SI58_9BACT|nr:hypothetical protein [Halalkalibaculum roseum]NGP75041.1 hypothetical protein [Halalkalibaculum roseum]